MQIIITKYGDSIINVLSNFASNIHAFYRGIEMQSIVCITTNKKNNFLHQIFGRLKKIQKHVHCATYKIHARNISNQ